MKKQSYFTGELGQRFSFRKYLGVGLCSVALGTMFLTANNHQVKADTVGDGDASSKVQANSNDSETESEKQASVVKETSPATPATQAKSASTDTGAQTDPKVAQAPVENKNAVAQPSGAQTQSAQAQAQSSQNTAQASQPTAGATNNGASHATNPLFMQAFTLNKRAASVSGQPNAVSAVAMTSGNGETSHTVLKDQKTQAHININYHYAKDSDPKQGDFAVDEANAGKEYKAGEKFDVDVTYDSDFDPTSGKTTISNIRFSPVNTPDDLNVKVVNDSNGSQRVQYRFDFYKGTTDSNGYPVDFYKYGAIVNSTTKAGFKDPESKTNADYLESTNVPTAYFSLSDGPTAVFEHANSAVLQPSTVNVDVLYYKRPYKVVAQYQDGDGAHAPKVGEQQNWGTLYFDSPIAKKLTPPDDRYELIQPDKSNANVSMTDQGAITNDNPNILNADSDSDGKGVITVNLPIELKHKTTTYDHNSTTYPPDFTEKDFDETITRNIITKGNPNGDTTVPQTTHVYRTGTYDLVTKKMTYNDDWTTGQLPDYTAQQVKGYTANPSYVSSVYVNHGDKPADVVITYTKDPVNSVSKGFQLVDADNHDTPVGNQQTVTDVPGTTHNISLPIPPNYKLKDGVTIPPNYTLKDGDSGVLTYEVVHVHKDVSDTDPGAKKDVTRTIVVTDPEGNVTKTPQTAHFTRSADKDMVTGTITYGEWSKDATLPAYDVKQLDNYDSKIDYNDGKGKQAGKKVAELVVNHDSKDSEVNVTYDPIKGSTTITYVDKDNNNTPVKTDTKTGNKGTETPFTPDPPKGYEVVPGTNVPGKVTIGGDSITIPVQKKDVGQDIHYVYTDPKDPDHKKQVVGTDTVTGKPDTKVPYKPADHVPSGYKLQDPKNAPTQVTITDNNTPIEIPVDKIDGGQLVNYTDPDGKVVKHDTIPGDRGTDVPFTPDVPDGWVIVDPNKVPKNIKIDPDNPLNIPIKHGEVQVDKPMNKGDIVPGTKGNKMDQDITDPDLNKQITRTIVMNMPDGNVKDEVQVVTAHRSAIVDQVTGKIIRYTPYTANKGGYDEYVVPEVKGYTPTQKTVPAEKVDPNTAKDEVVVINYKKNPDKNTNGGGNGGSITPSTPVQPVQPNQPSAPTQPTVPSQPTQTSETKQEEDKIIPQEAFRFKGDKAEKVGRGPVVSTGNYTGPAVSGGAGNVVGTPATITAPTVSAAPSQAMSSPAQAAAQPAQANALPQTGSVQNTAVIALGLALMTMSFGAVVMGKKKED